MSPVPIVVHNLLSLDHIILNPHGKVEKFERLGIKMFGKFQYIVFYSQCKNAEAEKFSLEKDVLLFLFVKFFKNLFKIKQLCPSIAAVTLLYFVRLFWSLLLSNVA